MTRNPSTDPEPYTLEGTELTARWILPGWGSAIRWFGEPWTALLIITLSVAAITILALKVIWAESEEEAVAEDAAVDPAAGVVGDEGGGSFSRNQRRAVVGVILAVLASSGIAWSLFTSSQSVANNSFGTTECFDAQLAQVQSGTAVNASSGVTSIPIGAVDPASSFLLFSARSNGGSPADSQVMGVLQDGTTITFTRATTNPTPPPITIAWSVIEYGCGVSVQRGSVAGSGTTSLDVAIASVGHRSKFRDVVRGG